MKAASFLPGEVHVWTVALQSGAERIRHCETMLAENERSRADRFMFPDDRRRYVAAHGALREVLGHYLGRPPAGLVMETKGEEKPLLASADEAWLHFNLSHSGELAVIACASEHEVGVDVEWMRDEVDLVGVVETFFSETEKAEWAALPENEKRGAFFHAWVCKEAYVKGLGTGLHHPSKSYTVRVAAAGPAALLADALHPAAPGEWSLHPVPVPLGYRAALAAARGVTAVRTRAWAAD